MIGIGVWQIIPTLLMATHTAAFVEVVASIADKVIVEALRNLWQATYDYIHKTMWGNNEKAKAEYEATKAQVMAVIQPQYAMAA